MILASNRPYQRGSNKLGLAGLAERLEFSLGRLGRLRGVVGCFTKTLSAMLTHRCAARHPAAPGPQTAERCNYEVQPSRCSLWRLTYGTQPITPSLCAT